jgi:hypothetical protein
MVEFNAHGLADGKRGSLFRPSVIIRRLAALGFRQRRLGCFISAWCRQQRIG